MQAIPIPMPDAETSVIGGIVRRTYRLPAGVIIGTHTHSYDHLSVLYSGKAQLFRNGGLAEILNGPCAVVIAKDVSHEILALTDCVWDCIHAFAEAKAAHDAGDPYALFGVKD